VGNVLRPGFDVKEVSARHVQEIFLALFSPLRLAKESFRNTPELLDALTKAPLLITEGLRLIESASQRPAENPLGGLHTTLLAGACMIAAAILVSFAKPWYFWAPLIAASVLLALSRRR
jgi:hypothetical protein